jgi:hypothetical protein
VPGGGEPTDVAHRSQDDGRSDGADPSDITQRRTRSRDGYTGRQALREPTGQRLDVTGPPHNEPPSLNQARLGSVARARVSRPVAMSFTFWTRRLGLFGTGIEAVVLG